MTTSERHVHLVGSLPADDAEQAMSGALDLVGDRLALLPDGETGERFRWITHIVDSLGDHPDLEVVTKGDWSDYDHISKLRVRRGHRLDGTTLDFGHVKAFEESYPVFTALREQSGRPDLTFQVGVPGDLDMALFTLGPIKAFRHRRAFATATLAEIRAIHAQAGDAVLFQLEVPVELVFVAKMPRPAQKAMAAFLARGLVDLVKPAPAGARFGVHLCVGDLGNKALGKLGNDVGPLVALANAIVSRWPHGRPLEFVHAPFAAGDEPAPTSADFYRPLDGLRLPPQVRFVAGFVHEGQGPAEHEQILRTIESSVGRRVDVASACGLGRRSHEAAEASMRRAAEVAAVPA
ncbi:MAG TPA: hypothetical protein VIP77_12275 [Jiangellaceae bacterium]